MLPVYCIQQFTINVRTKFSFIDIKRVRSEMKKMSTNTLKLQKKVKKGLFLFVLLAFILIYLTELVFVILNFNFIVIYYWHQSTSAMTTVKFKYKVLSITYRKQ